MAFACEGFAEGVVGEGEVGEGKGTQRMRRDQAEMALS